MSTCTLTLYKTKITPERNCIVEGIQNYLNGIVATRVYLNFQYQKIGLDINVKVPVDQKYANLQELGNYADILQDSKHYYYFILDASWAAQGVVSLQLSFDTLNTYQNDWTFSSKTNITRTHKNRWFNNNTVMSPNTTYSKVMVVDKLDEGITNVPTEMSKTVVEDNESVLRCKWYLVYRTDDNLTSTSNQAVRCELYPEVNTLRYVSSGNIIYPSDLVENRYYYCCYNGLNNENNGVQVGIGTVDGTTNANHFPGMVFKKTSSTSISYRFFSYRNTTESGIQFKGLEPYLSAWVGASSLAFSGNVATIRYTDDDTSKVWMNAGTVGSYTIYQKLTSGDSPVNDISNVNRTDSRLIKIIECPYCPIDIEVDSSNRLTLPTGWVFQGATITCNDLTIELERSYFGSQVINSMKKVITTGANVAKMARNNDYEPKILHSSISPFKLLYDSFESEVRREQITPNNGANAPTIRISYKQANTITSNLAFKWEISVGGYTNISDYDNILVAKRNNETPIYTSNYLDYIRTGYNYDKKVVNKQVAQSIISTSLNLAAVGTGFALKAVTGGLSVAASISQAGSAVSSITGTIFNSINAYQSLNQKKAELAAQAASVSGSDDINLLNYYGDGNRLTIREYTPINSFKDKLCDLFYYCGYINDSKGVPVVNSRYWFNYIQCDPVFTNTENEEVYSNYLDDIKAKFNIGVTYYHRHNAEYDWNQEYENWEIGLVS